MTASSTSRSQAAQLLPAMPLAALFMLGYAVPLGVLAVASFAQTTSLDGIGWAQYARFFGDAFNWSILGGTLWLGLQVTLLTALIAYPLALSYRQCGPRMRAFMLFMILLPMLTSTVIRTFAWLVLLGKEGIVNSVLVALHVVDEPARLLYTRGALVIALSQICLPLMAMPLINSLLRIDDNLLRASEGLGASSWRMLGTLLVPLSMPGLVAGSLMTFSMATTAFVTQTLVGGGRQLFMPAYIYQQATGLQNFNFAAAVSIIFMLTVVGLVAFAGRLANRKLGRIYGAIR